MEQIRVHLIISGRVQGVAFRAAARQAAQHLTLTGWVRNKTNGTVEILAEGTDKQISEFILWAHQGPRYAEVNDVQIEQSAATGEFAEFFITH